MKNDYRFPPWLADNPNHSDTIPPDSAEVVYRLTLLMRVVSEGDAAAVAHWLPLSNVDARLASNTPDRDLFGWDTRGATALHLAVLSGHKETLALLLRSANPNAKTDRMETPLMMAACDGFAACVRALLACGDTDAWGLDGWNGWTALHYAACGGDTDCIQALLSTRDSEPLAIDQEERTALHVAAYLGHAPCLSLLLSCIDPRALDSKGNTALHLAARGGHADCVRVLLPLSDALAMNSSRRRPAALAKAGGHFEALGVIEAYLLAQRESKALRKASNPHAGARRLPTPQPRRSPSL